MNNHTIETFTALKADEMRAHLEQLTPSLTKVLGKPVAKRATKDAMVALYTHWLQATSTSAGQVEAPALQNIPLRTEEGRQLREAFAEKPVLEGADYPALEARVAAELAAEPDPHSQAAAKMMMVPSYGGAVMQISAPVEAAHVAQAPRGRGRRDEVAQAIRAKGDELVQLLVQTKQALGGRGNRRTRRRASALVTRAARNLPPGVTLDEALALVG